MGVSADRTFERPRKARQQRPAGAASAMGSGLHDAKAPPQMQRWRGSPSRTPLASGGIKGGGEYGITSLAQRQLAEKLKIPFACFERMRAGHPDLLDRNVNTWLHTEGDRRMIRTLDGQVRAVLSDRYRRLDDFDLAESVLPILQRPEGARFESVELTDTKMYLKVITPGVEFEVAPGDIVQAGIVITNSEVGCGTLSVQPLLYRLVCKNGLIASDRKRPCQAGAEGPGPRYMKRREHRPRRCCPAPALDRSSPPRPVQPHGCPGIFCDVSSADARGPLGRVAGTTSGDILSRTGCYTSSCQERPPRERSKRPGSAKLLRGRALVTRR